MSQVFNPGRLIVDETSTLGDRLLAGDAPVRPEPTLWRESILRWLTTVASTRVGASLLRALSERRGVATGVRIVPHSRVGAGANEAQTTGPRPDSVDVVVTLTPADARGRPLSLDPMIHPAPVLVHELLHALMFLHGLSDVHDASGRTLDIAGWQATGVYPSANEFLATVVQNMFLSEQGMVLSDGYSGDDPFIDSRPAASAPANATGRRSTGGGVDLAGFVAAYQVPLLFLRHRLPAFTQELAGLRGVAFNPFRHISRGVAVRDQGGVRATNGAARLPAPL